MESAQDHFDPSKSLSPACSTKCLRGGISGKRFLHWWNVVCSQMDTERFIGRPFRSADDLKSPQLAGERHQRDHETLRGRDAVWIRLHIVKPLYKSKSSHGGARGLTRHDGSADVCPDCGPVKVCGGPARTASRRTTGGADSCLLIHCCRLRLLRN